MYNPPLYLNELHHALEKARVKSWEDTKAVETVSNAKISGYFCSLVGDFLHPIIERSWPNPSLKRRQISTKLNGKNEGGEWLLDIVWGLGGGLEPVQEGEPTVAQRYDAVQAIVCAVECESSTSGKELFRDLAKLLVAKAPLKIFLGGLDQTTKNGTLHYIERRLAEIQKFITGDSARWFVGFWPSPKGDLWKGELPSFLQQIYLYERLGAGECGWRLADPITNTRS